MFRKYLYDLSKPFTIGSSIATLLLMTSCAILPSPAHAQQPGSGAGTTVADLYLDGRARVADGQSASRDLHSEYLSLHSDALMGRRAFVDVQAINQYNSFRYQRASVGTRFDVRLRRAVPANMDEDTSADTLPLRLEAGIVRIPFGIYDYEETYTSGLIDYPLPRLDYAYDSVDWGVAGLKATGSRGPVQIEAAGFSGAGQGTWGNFNHVDGGAVRVQSYLPPPLVVGASVWQGHQANAPGLGGAPVSIAGIDGRFTREYLLLRGEAMVGTLAGDHMHGGYLDAYYRLPGVSQVTLVGRVEALKPATDQPEARQLTLGARWVFSPDWTLSGNWQRNNIANAYLFTWTEPTRKGGAVLFQLLHRIPLR